MEHRKHAKNAASPRADRTKAELYRMVTPEHICPFGLKSLDLLEREGFAVADHKLRSRKATDDFMAEQHVRTTPQTFIDGKRIGGYDALRKHFGKQVPDSDAVSYTPVIAVFGMALLMATAATFAAEGTLLTPRLIGWFVAFAMTILAILKLRDLEGFSNMFLGYDLLAQR